VICTTSVSHSPAQISQTQYEYTHTLHGIHLNMIHFKRIPTLPCIMQIHDIKSYMEDLFKGIIIESFAGEGSLTLRCSRQLRTISMLTYTHLKELSYISHIATCFFLVFPDFSVMTTIDSWPVVLPIVGIRPVYHKQTVCLQIRSMQRSRPRKK